MMLSVRGSFFVLHIALVQLAFSVSSYLAYGIHFESHKFDSPGFLRAGRNHVYFVNRVTLGTGCPAVSVSCLGGTTGVINSYCMLFMLI
jgi:hypothetical protein